MSRAVKQKRRATPSVQRQPTALGSGKGNGVQRKAGTERPDAATSTPVEGDGTARIIKTGRS